MASSSAVANTKATMPVAAKQPPAAEVLVELQGLRGELAVLREMMENKLRDFCFDSSPLGDENKKSVDLPPYFYEVYSITSVCQSDVTRMKEIIRNFGG